LRYCEKTLYEGYWGHTGIYAGNNNIVESYPDCEIPSVCTSPGVVYRDIEQSGFWQAQYYLVLRLKPSVAPGGKGQAAVDEAKRQQIKPYSWDYPNKTREDQYYCTQLVWHSYNVSPDSVDIDSNKSNCRIFRSFCRTAVTPDEIAGTKDSDSGYQAITNIVDSLQPTKAVAFYVNDVANLYITDPNGRHAGFDPVTHQEINEMPDQVFFSGSSVQLRVLTVNNMEGQWDIKLIGTTGGFYTFASAPVADSSLIKVVTGNISYGQIVDYPITYPPRPRSFLYLPVVLKRYAYGEQPPTPTSTPTSQPAGWVTIVSEDFEGSFPSSWWLLDNNGTSSGEYYWGKRTCRPYAGSHSGWGVGGGANGAALNCGSNYPDNADSWMVYGPFSLAGATAGDLSFKLWLNSESNNDEVCRFASINGSHFYGTCTSGNTSGWMDKVLDLTNVYTLGNLMGQPNVWVALRFDSDSATNYPEGGYVDNLVLRKCTSATCTGTSGAESDSDQGNVMEIPVATTLAK
jgi:hypothetical protein